MLEEVFFMNYNKIEIDEDILLVAAWNRYKRGGDEVSLNNEEFFENTFENKYDAAWAVSLSLGDWDAVDRFVYFSPEGHLVSFTHWDDAKSPVDIDKIDTSNLVNLKNVYCPVDNIPRAIHDALIHDALKEV